MAERPNTLEAFRVAIESSEGFRRRSRARAMGYMLYTFGANATELRRQVELYGNPGSAMIRLLQRQNVADEQLRSDVLRALHNFLASAKSLVDHARIYMNEVYADHPLLAEYQARVGTDFTSTPVVQFVHELRNYMLHKGIPVLFENLGLRSGEQPTFTVALDLGAMRDAWGWNRTALLYLDSQSKHSEILPIVNEYLGIVFPFYHWLADRRHEVDKDVMEELQLLKDELRQYTLKFHSGLA